MVNINHALSGRNVLLFLIAFRICNALLVRTFFQPDEYFQSLEPAWQIAFGSESNAWITWEWRERLRSSLHPVLFAGVYYSTNWLADLFGLSLNKRSDLLLAGPKVLQAVIAALSDYYTWRLAQKTYGKSSAGQYATLCLTICSPWRWFCATRTFSNCLETTLTVVGLYHWPFESLTIQDGEIVNWTSHSRRVRFALLFAALASILRPTNIIIWLIIVLNSAIPTGRFDIAQIVTTLFLESQDAFIAGSCMLVITHISDHFFYQAWTFPPANFLNFNLVKSLSVFYGRNRPDYYLTEGLPLLLTTTLPFAGVGIWQALTRGSASTLQAQTTERVLRTLAYTVLAFIFVMSLIAHKEVRFIYPLLPLLHVIAARPVATFFSPLPWPLSLSRKALLSTILLVNVVIAYYTTQIHQRGVIDVTHALREQYEWNLMHDPSYTTGLRGREFMSVMFFMPCHSTPWRSHLVYSEIEARALTCEPPLGVPISERSTYMDEADQFYDDPVKWMQENMESLHRITPKRTHEIYVSLDGIQDWPDYLVFFEQLESTMQEYLGKTRYAPRRRFFNTHWHDDWRRKGDVVVWQLMPEPDREVVDIEYIET